MAAEQPESAPIRRPGAANSPEGYPGSPEGLRGAERPTAEELAEWRAKADAATEGRSKDAELIGDALVYGDARIFDSARVYGDARVHGNALISGNADLARSRHVLTLGPVGSGDRTVTIHRHYDGPSAAKWGHRINAGCWSGTLGELADRIAGDGHGWPAGLVDRCRADYRAVIVVARIRVAEWEAEPLTAADHERWAS